MGENPNTGFKGLRLHNTLTRAKEDFVPIDSADVRMYVCGPTVYDDAHIGNARPAIVFDVLYRLLKHLYERDGGKVTYVRNITDVDDKIIDRARRDFPDMALNEAIAKVTAETEARYHADVKALGCLEPTVEPRATEHIPEMIEMVRILIERNRAYEAEGHVLFDVKSWRNENGEAEYGKLSRRSLDEMIAGARVEVAPYKRDPVDFVLWKPSGDEEPGWESPWGRGRPGWHLECSAMSDKWLWEEMLPNLSESALAKPHRFDIHGGGVDLVFPHHENEIAQSRCAHGTEVMANYWLHNGFLQVEGEKMAKSAGNFVTIHELLESELPALVGTEDSEDSAYIRRHWNGLAARFSMLQTKYREPIDWTERRFKEASDELYGWYELLRNHHHDVDLETGRDEEVATALLDDLNTWEAITSLRAAYKKQDSRTLGEGMELLGLRNRYFVEADDILLFDRTAGADEAKVDALIAARTKARAAKNWAEADRIRDELEEMGIELTDTGAQITEWRVKR